MSFNETEMKLDEKKLSRIKFRIFNAERENIKTRAETEGEMIDKIRKIIEEEVRKCY
ncbi:MAG: hypothetical protein KBA53_00220 [Thermoclostridium sp.]|nr:hypothetical protein [Thermoclostridium sp.]